MTSPYRGSKIPGSQQSYGRKVLATLENTVIIFLSPQKTFCIVPRETENNRYAKFWGGTKGLL